MEFKDITIKLGKLICNEIIVMSGRQFVVNAFVRSVWNDNDMEERFFLFPPMDIMRLIRIYIMEEYIHFLSREKHFKINVLNLIDE